jgi:hypothetical protein
VKAFCTMANEGEVVWVKVISVKVEDSKTRIGCSMKYVNQEDGGDLDPNNTQLEQQSSHPKTLQVEHYKVQNHFSKLIITLLSSSLDALSHD